MSDKRVCYLNVAQTPMHQQSRQLLLALALLVMGALAVGYRTYLCQAQAYAIIALTLVSACIFLVHTSQRADNVVQIHRNVYCSDLSKTSHIAVVPGRNAAELASNYERLYFTRVRIWLPLYVWLAWIAYGALFHSGKHADHIAHDLLIDVAAVGEQIPALVQSFRIYLLALCAFASLAAANVARFERSAVEAARGNDLHGCVWLVFILSLFLPASESTAQALVPTRLVARTVFFYVLFVLGESLARLAHHERWLLAYREPTRAVLIAMQIALGRAKPMTLNKNRVGELASQIEALSPHAAQKHARSADFLRNEMIKYNSVLQSAWLLVASESAYALALAQVLLMLALHVHIRRRIATQVRERQHEYLCVNIDQSVAHQPTPVLPFASRNNRVDTHVAASAAPAGDEKPTAPWPAAKGPPTASPKPASRQSRSRVVDLHRDEPQPQTATATLPAAQTGPVRRKSASPQARHAAGISSSSNSSVPSDFGAPAATETESVPSPASAKTLSDSDARRLALRMMMTTTATATDEASAKSN